MWGDQRFKITRKEKVDLLLYLYGFCFITISTEVEILDLFKPKVLLELKIVEFLLDFVIIIIIPIVYFCSDEKKIGTKPYNEQGVIFEKVSQWTVTNSKTKTLDR